MRDPQLCRRFAASKKGKIMKKWRSIFFLTLLICFAMVKANAQCSICTKTSMQQGEKAGKGMNGGIVYLMATPFAVMGIIGYRWWKNEKKKEY